MSERDELVEYLRICGACHGCGIGADGDTCANCGDQRQPNRRAADLLERDGAELERLRAENKRLTRERDDPGTTHADGCASWGPKHYACALARLESWERASQEGHPDPCTLGPLCPYCEIARLRAEVERLTADQNAVSEAIGTNEYLDPPDGGDVPLAEQVRRMRAEIERLKAGGCARDQRTTQYCAEAKAALARAEAAEAQLRNET